VVTISVVRSPALRAPSGIIAAAGDVWFTNIGDDTVGRVRDGAVETFADPAGAVKFPANIHPGADGRIWFTSLGSDALVAIDPADPASMVSYPLPPGSRPVALKSGPDGRLWFSLRGADAIGSLDPTAASPLDTLTVVRADTISGPAALFVTARGQIWWVNSANGTLGALDGGTVTAVTPLKGSPRAWAQTPDGRLWVTTREPAGLLSFDPADPVESQVHVTDDCLCEPDGVWVGPDAALWFVDTAANAIVRHVPDGDDWQFFGGPPNVEGPFDIKAGPDGTDLWFTNKAGDSIGRIEF
jgi:virginiamycin B lyase